MTHPRIFPRGTRQPATGQILALVYAPSSDLMAWIDGELTRAQALIQTARSVRQLVAALVDDPAPRPQVLVIDLDAVSPGEMLELHEIRERGWTGAVLALGRVPASLRRSLGVEAAIVSRRPDALSDEIVRHRYSLESVTKVIPVVSPTAD